jgi:DNA-binding NtrC family response regulator
MSEGWFRTDLFYRLNVMQLKVPPLRERMEDVPYLTAAFVQEFATRLGKDICGLTPGAERVLSSWTWPGNVRELRNAIERACLVADGAHLTERDIQLGLDRRSLYRRLERYGLDASPSPKG